MNKVCITQEIHSTCISVEDNQLGLLQPVLQSMRHYNYRAAAAIILTLRTYHIQHHVTMCDSLYDSPSSMHLKGHHSSKRRRIRTLWLQTQQARGVSVIARDQRSPRSGA